MTIILLSIYLIKVFKLRIYIHILLNTLIIFNFRKLTIYKNGYLQLFNKIIYKY